MGCTHLADFRRRLVPLGVIPHGQVAADLEHVAGAGHDLDNLQQGGNGKHAEASGADIKCKTWLENGAVRM